MNFGLIAALILMAAYIGYPTSGLPFLGWTMHWLIAFFLLSIIFGFALKGLFKVEI